MIGKSLLAMTMAAFSMNAIPHNSLNTLSTPDFKGLPSRTRLRKYKAKNRRQTWDFLGCTEFGRGLFVCRQNGEVLDFPITSTRGFSQAAKKHFGLEA
jgi:hypothetical protein